MTNEELRRMRKAKGFTQAELAIHIGYSRQAVIHWENSIHPVPEEAAVKIMAACVSPTPAKSPSKLVKATVEAYRDMRGQPGWGHTSIIEFWQQEKFTPCREAMEQIAAEWPDILEGK